MDGKSESHTGTELQGILDDHVPGSVSRNVPNPTCIRQLNTLTQDPVPSLAQGSTTDPARLDVSAFSDEVRDLRLEAAPSIPSSPSERTTSPLSEEAEPEVSDLQHKAIPDYPVPAPERVTPLVTDGAESGVSDLQQGTVLITHPPAPGIVTPPVGDGAESEVSALKEESVSKSQQPAYLGGTPPFADWAESGDQKQETRDDPKVPVPTTDLEACTTSQERSVILVGKAGNGKSSTGNSVLGEAAFVSKRSLRSVTQHCQVRTSFRSDVRRQYTVVDTPGLFDTERPIGERALGLQDALEVCHRPHVFLIVLSTSRFTTEEQLTMDMLHVALGKGFVNHAIVVFTRGSEFESDEDFTDFLQENESVMSLIEQCGRRVVRVENSPRCDAATNETLIHGLFDMIEKLSEGGNIHYQYESLSVHRRCLENHLKNRTECADLGEELKQLTEAIVCQLEEERRRLEVEHQRQLEMEREELNRQLEQKQRQLELEKQAELRQMEEEARVLELQREEERRQLEEKNRQLEREREEEREEERKRAAVEKRRHMETIRVMQETRKREEREQRMEMERLRQEKQKEKEKRRRYKEKAERDKERRREERQERIENEKLELQWKLEKSEAKKRELEEKMKQRGMCALM